MNLKPILRIQCRREYKIFRVMYLIVYAIVAVNVLGELFLSGGKSGLHSSGLELATIITIFIAGLHSFKDFFPFYSANGVSRRRACAGITVSLAVAACCTALIDSVNLVIYSLFMSYSPMYLGKFHDLATFSMEKHPAAGVVPSAPLLLDNLIWCFCAYLVFGLFGFLLSLLYYRMNRAQKLTFTFGALIFLFLFLPIFDQNVAGGRITAALMSAFGWWLACAASPISDAVTHLCLAALLAGSSFLLIRRTEVRR